MYSAPIDPLHIVFIYTKTANCRNRWRVPNEANEPPVTTRRQYLANKVLMSIHFWKRLFWCNNFKLTYQYFTTDITLRKVRVSFPYNSAIQGQDDNIFEKKETYTIHTQPKTSIVTLWNFKPVTTNSRYNNELFQPFAIASLYKIVFWEYNG